MKYQWWEMENNELLEQEEAFHKINAELELRTRQLMRDVEAVITSRSDTRLCNSDVNSFRSELTDPSTDPVIDGFTNVFKSSDRDGFDSPLSFNREHKYGSLYDLDTVASATGKRSNKIKASCSRKASRSNIDKSYDDIIPAAAKDLGSDGLMRFLRTKVKMLQSQLVTLQYDFTARTDELRKTQNELKQIDEDKTRALQDSLQHKDKLRRQEHLSSTLLDKLQVRDSENSILRKQLESTKNELKKAITSATTNESKCNKAKEDVERLKQNLRQSQQSEKETRDRLRVKSEQLTISVRKLEKQKSELISGFKKQLNLIDNLKRQKTLKQIDGVLKHSEDDFMRLLDA